MELSGYFGVARRWWLALLGSVVLAAVGGYVVASGLPKVYEGEAKVLVGPINTDFDTQRAAGQLANTYAQLATSRQVSEAVLARLAIQMAPEDLQAATSAIPNDVTRLVIIRVQDVNAARAADLANGVADAIGTLAAENQRPEGQTQLIDPAVPPTTPVAPQVLLIVLLATFAGFLAAISLVVLIEYARDSVRSEDELRELSGVPILGRVTSHLDRSGDIASAILGSRSAEAYRALTARVEHSLGARKVRSVLVTGLPVTRPTASAATVVGTGLALAFVDRGIRAAIIDGNPDDSAAEALGVSANRGSQDLGDGRGVAMQRVEAVVAAKHAARPRTVALDLVPGGGTDLVKAEQLKRILEAVHRDADVGVVVAPPVDRSSEALLWAGVADAVLLVVPVPGARRRDVRAAVDALRVAGKRFVGAVVTDPPARRRKRSSARPAVTRVPNLTVARDSAEAHGHDLGRAG